VRPFACLCLGPSAGRLFALAAGVTWTSRTLAAPWAARRGHSTVIDARTHAIYVIGGYDGTTFVNDVLVSTDGGARPNSVGWSGVLGYSRVLLGYLDVPSCLWSTPGVLQDT
jgi:hypothetical protein